MKILAMLGTWSRRLPAALAMAALPLVAHGQAWDAVKFFQYNIENVVVTPAGPGTWDVRVIFSVTNPALGTPWNIRSDLPFTSAGASLTLDIGWDPATDFTNTGSANAALAAVTGTTLGIGAAIPVQVRNLQGVAGVATSCDADPLQCPGVPVTVNRFWVQKRVTPVAFTAPVKYGRVAIEGKPVCNGIGGFACPTAVAPFAAVPVPSVVASFALTSTQSLAAIVPDPRRKVVDIAKCHQCHDGKQHGATVVPRLSLHGNNRTENLSLCIMCHNPNQTDVPYRYQTAGTPADPKIAGPETAIDFKVLVHSIHAGGFRQNPYVVIGFNSSVNDFSYVRFPRELRDCTNCHIDANGKGTFELPIKSTLGSTVNTQSTYLVAPGATRSINVNPADDLRITPTAATCSACHDRSEVKQHMVRTGGASFATTQASIGTTVKEKCASCHGPGKEEDVRRAHEIGGGCGGGGGGGGDD
jgi:OmcA/MtrC family decaheme c-type cytochrome